MNEALDSSDQSCKLHQLNTRPFKKFSKGINSDDEALLLCSIVRWMAKGYAVNLFFKIKNEIKLFLQGQKKHSLLNYSNEKKWTARVAYLTDIFDHL